MAGTMINGATQIKSESIGNGQIATGAAIATSKLAGGSDFMQRDGSVAMTGNLALGTNRITGLGTPSSSTDAATKAYVDSVINGTKWKIPVRFLATGNTTLSGSQTVDGGSPSDGDRIGCFSQTTTTEDGIYVYNSSGAWARSDDFAAASVQANAAFFVSEGTANADTQWTITNNAASAVVGTDNLVLAQIGAGTSYSAGSGLQLSGTTFSIYFVNMETPSGTINGSNDAFSLANSPVSGSVMLFLNGVLLEAGSGNDYTISGTSITMATAPSSGDKLRATYFR
jgi:hypothetical protein